MIQVFMKTCSRKDCNQINPQNLNHFYSCKRNKDKLRNECISCCKVYSQKPDVRINKRKYGQLYYHSGDRKIKTKQYREKTKDKRKNRLLKYLYGITYEDYSKL